MNADDTSKEQYFVYILWSASLKRYYTGFSQYRFKRQRQHRKGQSNWSHRADDWEEVWHCEIPSRLEARSLERRIKARGAQRFLHDQKPTGSGM
jgi:putative endonuclease